MGTILKKWSIFTDFDGFPSGRVGKTPKNGYGVGKWK